MELGLDKKVAFISGSSRGIGKEIAKTFLSEGAKVAINGREDTRLKSTEMELTAEFPGRVLAVLGDSGDTKVASSALKFIGSTFESLDILVCNVGTGKALSKDRLDMAEWQRLFEANIFGAVRLVESLLPLMKEKNGGAIIFVSSIAGIERNQAPWAYSAAKAALLSLSKNMSEELASHRIRVNSVLPGHIFFEGGRWEEIIKSQSDVKQEIERDIPLGRFGSPQDVANAVTFLASDAASYITGAALVVDGGLSRRV